jgi:hypothetical protein
VKLNEIQSFDTDIGETFFNVLDDVLGREAIVERKFAAAGPAPIFRRNFCGDVKLFVQSSYGIVAFIGAKNLSEKLFAVAVAIGPGGIEKISSKIDGTLQRRERFFIFRAGPTGHAPHAVANFTDVPSGAAESAVVHR